MPVLLDKARMSKLKCPSCGSKDKNTAAVKARLPGSSDDDISQVIKVVACNQCGHLTLYGISALAALDIITGGNLRTRDEYEGIVKDQHEGNHLD